ncbi:MAG TPA: hypothetical protein VME47_24875 [Acetobacteraceae bacterium]|nr:hypothetical protein [Acetobacteraceae bacterium]
MKIAGLPEHGQYSDTILCTHISVQGVAFAPRKGTKDSAMCSEQTTTFTLRGWLRDPMIRMVMESDGVTDHEMIVLVRRVVSAAALRPQAPTVLPAPGVEQRAAW